jgi:formate dehydrogenase alpha subunit
VVCEIIAMKLIINERQIEADEGQTVLEAARRHGISIPTLCHHPDLHPVGSCRLCVVEAVPGGQLLTACTLPVREGLNVRTDTPAVVVARRAVLEFLLQDYADADDAAADREATEFERYLQQHGLRARAPTERGALRKSAVDSDPNPVVWVDWNKCILCTRCVRACADLQGRFVWGVGGRGHGSRIVAGADTDLLSARCESCGTCVAYCPTGALDDKPSVGRGRVERVVTTTCGYCGVGCQLDLHVRGERIILVTSPGADGAMQLCVKGRYGYDFVHHPERLSGPQVRRYLLDGRERPGGRRDEWVAVDWDTALALTAEKLSEIRRESGPQAIGFFSSAKCTNEENYLMQKFARQVVGTHSVDHCARLCHSSTVAGLASCYGSGAMSNTMQDIVQHAAAIFLIGSNTTEQHPVFGARLRQAVLQRGVPLIVADPRRIDITEFATRHLRHRPGTDVALLNGLMHVILDRGWQDQAFIDARCEGFESFRRSIQAYTPSRVAEITGVPAEQLEQAAELLARRRPAAAIWSMGITQHTSGVLNVLALGNLQMLLGNLGVPGGGVNPLRGQNNVQGACDVGALPNVLPGYQPVTDAAVRERFAAVWRVEAAAGTTDRTEAFRLDDRPGLTVTEMVDQAGSGGVRALYIMGENPAMTDPDVNHARACLEACELVILQEIFPSQTADMADILLPGVSWAEKSGTVTNTDRRIQLVRQALPPHGDARPDWIITAELARRMLAREGRVPAGPWAGWEYASPVEIMAEIAALTPIYAGASHARLERGDVVRWPVPAAEHPGTPILHVGRFTRGLGKFHVTEHLAAEELPDDRYPLVLTTGRVLYHWHGAEMTRRSQALLELYPETVVEISPEDAARIGCNGRTHVRVASRRGEVTARALVTERVAPGLVFGNFHFPGAQNVNNLTIAALDPVAKIPEYKVCAVRIEAAGDE